MTSTFDFLTQLSEDWEDTLSTDSVQRLEQLSEELGKGEALSASQHEEATLLLQTIADVCRNEDNRLLFTHDALPFLPIVSCLRAALSLGLGACALQCLRAASNLCYEHTANRLKFLHASAVPLLPSALALPDLLRPCAAFVANLASEEDPCLAALLDTPEVLQPLLAAFLAAADVDTVNRAVVNLLQAPAFSLQRPPEAQGHFAALLALLSSPAHPARPHAVAIFTALLADPRQADPAVLPLLRRFAAHLLADLKAVPLLLDALSRPCPDEAQLLAEQADLPYFAERKPLPRQQVGLLLALVVPLAEEDALARHFEAALPQLLAMATSRQDLIAQRCAAACLGALVLESPAARGFCAEHLQLLLDAMAAQELPHADTDTQVGLMLALANTLDAKERSEQYVALGAPRVLIKFLDQQYDPRVVHLVLGTFQKLTLDPAHKRLAVELGIVPAVDAVLNTSRDVTILFSAVSILRSLVALHDPEFQRPLVQEAPVLATLGSLWERVWEKGTERVLYEAARILAHLIVDGWAQACMEKNVVHQPLASLLSSPHEILRNEAWRAISVLFADASLDRAVLFCNILNAIDTKETTALNLSKLPHIEVLLPIILESLQASSCRFHPTVVDLSSNTIPPSSSPLLESWINQSTTLTTLDLNSSQLDIPINIQNSQIQILR